MVNDDPADKADEKTFTHNTPDLIEHLDKTLQAYSQEHNGMDIVAVIAALSYLLCHAAHHMGGVSKEKLLFGVAMNYDFLAEGLVPVTNTSETLQ